MRRHGRLLALYLRSRNVPHASAGLLGLLVVSGWDAQWLGWRLPDIVLVFSAVLAAVLLAGSFASPSPELDASAALPWRRWRVSHALTSLALCGVLLAVATAFHRHGTLGFDLISLRNLLGFGGLALTTAVFTGAWLSWTTPITYALVAWVFSPASSTWGRAFLWPLLPVDSPLSWWPVLTLSALGTTLIAVYGARSSIGR